MFGGLRTDKAGSTKHGYWSDASGSVLMEATPTTIWNVITDPAVFPDGQAGFEGGWVLPGTGPGPGEVHATLFRTPGTGNRVLRGQVVEEDQPPHFRRLVSLDPPPSPPSAVEITLVERDQAVEVGIVFIRYFAPGTAAREIREYEQAIRTSAVRYLQELGKLLGVRVTAVPAAYLRNPQRPSKPPLA